MKRARATKKALLQPHCSHGNLTTPPWLVTDSRDAENLRLRAANERLKRPDRGKSGRPPKYSSVVEGSLANRALSRLGDMYENMRTAPATDTPLPPGTKLPLGLEIETRWSTVRTPWLLPELLEFAAAMIDAQRDGGPLPHLPAELVFVADCPAPMEHVDAVRNLAKFCEVGPDFLMRLLRKSDDQRVREGRDRLVGLPARRDRPGNTD
ncbi:MAG TPA: hypothetical protein VML91_10895 [Burkholderiales bacterium]|nr:hypothetical protein [Burkholderiales bacterium]